jgi:hypothetical protein
VSLGLVIVVLSGLLAGCDTSKLGPTENSFTPRVMNDTRSDATVVYCNRGPKCVPAQWTVTLSPGKSISSIVSVGSRGLAVLSVKEQGAVRCIRLERPVSSVRLSEATGAACHPPFG